MSDTTKVPFVKLRELVDRLVPSFPTSSDYSDAQVRICTILLSNHAANLRAILDEVDRLKAEMESPRYQPVPYSNSIIRRCEKCSGLVEVPSVLSQVGLTGCRACTAESRVKNLEREIAGLAVGWDFDAETSEPSSEYSDRIDALRECAASLRAVLAKLEVGQ